MTNNDGESRTSVPASSPAATRPSGPNPAVGEEREADAIYQKNRIVARVEAPEVSADGKSIHFNEVNHSENLLLPDECEFRQYRLVVRKIGYATKVEGHSLEKGRILQDVRAEILGHRQQ